MIVSIERLQQLAEAPIDDYHDLAVAVQHLAIAVLERSNGSSPAYPQPPAPVAPAKRMPGKPLGDKLSHPCSRCGNDVVTFISKTSQRPYPCDVEIGMYKNQRTVLTAANWFHKCKKDGQ